MTNSLKINSNLDKLILKELNVYRQEQLLAESKAFEAIRNSKFIQGILPPFLRRRGYLLRLDQLLKSQDKLAQLTTLFPSADQSIIRKVLKDYNLAPAFVANINRVFFHRTQFLNQLPLIPKSGKTSIEKLLSLGSKSTPNGKQIENIVNGARGNLIGYYNSAQQQVRAEIAVNEKILKVLQSNEASRFINVSDPIKVRPGKPFPSGAPRPPVKLTDVLPAGTEAKMIQDISKLIKEQKKILSRLNGQINNLNNLDDKNLLIVLYRTSQINPVKPRLTSGGRSFDYTLTPRQAFKKDQPLAKANEALKAHKARRGTPTDDVAPDEAPPRATDDAADDAVDDAAREIEDIATTPRVPADPGAAAGKASLVKRALKTFGIGSLTLSVATYATSRFVDDEVSEDILKATRDLLVSPDETVAMLKSLGFDSELAKVIGKAANEFFGKLFAGHRWMQATKYIAALGQVKIDGEVPPDRAHAMALGMPSFKEDESLQDLQDRYMKAYAQVFLSEVFAISKNPEDRDMASAEIQLRNTLSRMRENFSDYQSNPNMYTYYKNALTAAMAGVDAAAEMLSANRMYGVYEKLFDSAFLDVNKNLIDPNFVNSIEAMVKKEYNTEIQKLTKDETIDYSLKIAAIRHKAIYDAVYAPLKDKLKKFSNLNLDDFILSGGREDQDIKDSNKNIGKLLDLVSSILVDVTEFTEEDYKSLGLPTDNIEYTKYFTTKPNFYVPKAGDDIVSITGLAALTDENQILLFEERLGLNKFAAKRLAKFLQIIIRHIDGLRIDTNDPDERKQKLHKMSIRYRKLEIKQIAKILTKQFETKLSDAEVKKKVKDIMLKTISKEFQNIGTISNDLKNAFDGIIKEYRDREPMASSFD